MSRRLASLLLLTPASWAMSPSMIFASELSLQLAKYTTARIAEFDKIPAERRALLAELATYVQSQRDAARPVRLIFICTHNSRRSQMAQLWAAVAAAHFGVEEVETFSGGTEGTAFNPRAIAALRRAGFRVEPTTPGGENPHYAVHFAADGPTLECFSKAYGAAPNPTADFGAVMVCSQADEACPNVAGAAFRLALPYVDPKAADDSPEEAATYDERCAQIAREMLYAFSRLETSS